MFTLPLQSDQSSFYSGDLKLCIHYLGLHFKSNPAKRNTEIIKTTQGKSVTEIRTTTKRLPCSRFTTFALNHLGKRDPERDNLETTVVHCFRPDCRKSYFLIYVTL